MQLYGTGDEATLFENGDKTIIEYKRTAAASKSGH